jgi:hypothetical protein
MPPRDPAAPPAPGGPTEREWVEPPGWGGRPSDGPSLLPGAPGTTPEPAWSGFGDPGQPATTIVPSRGRGSRGLRRGSRKEAPDDHAGSAPDLDHLADFDEPDRSRLVSLIVFWAPAIILLLLAGVVIWSVR